MQYIRFNYPDRNGKLEEVSGYVHAHRRHQIVVSDKKESLVNAGIYETILIIATTE